MSDTIKDCETRMNKTLESVKADFASVRAGRANAAVLDHITVDYYGAATPLNQVSAISSPDPRSLVISPWDHSLLRAIEKAIQTSDLGINPQNDGKVAIRNIRRDGIDKIKTQKKKGEITEDDQKDLEKELQTLTDKKIKEMDALTAEKEKELMSV